MRKKKTKNKSHYTLEMDGKIEFVEYCGKKEIRTPIDGKLILKLVLRAIQDGIELMEKDRVQG